jgi:Tfp pilus assembly ATPase PilU
MVVNARIQDLVRDGKTEEIPEAIEEGVFFSMQTFMKALIDLVLAGEVERDVAANAASNRHDFLIALDRALKEQAVAAEEEKPVEPAESDEDPAEQRRPTLRVAGRPGS